MADLKITQLPVATTPLAGTEVLPIVQSGTTKQVTVTNFLPADTTTAANTQTLTNKTINIANNTLTGVQPTLVSGTNIKTINGNTVLGSGDLALGGASLSEFSTSGTWTKPAGANFVMVEAWGAGGGGGSGRRGAAGSTRLAGTGAGGGAYTQRLFKASDLTSTVTVTIGAGGTGAAAQTVNDTNGNVGVNGGNTTFGAFLTAFGGGGGGAGTTGAPIRYGGVGGGALTAGNGTGIGGDPIPGAGGGHFGSASQNYDDIGSGWGGGRGAQSTDEEFALYAAGCSFQGGPGGGAGGFITSANNATNGTAGGSIVGRTGGGAAGGTSGGAGAAGVGRQGAGGGGASTTAAAGIGGVGGSPAGGGGGGGASANGFNSGAGGAGGAGLVRVYTW